jgi:hypothetical protein
MGSKWDMMTRSLRVVVDNSNEVARVVESVLTTVVRTDASSNRLEIKLWQSTLWSRTYMEHAQR